MSRVGPTLDGYAQQRLRLLHRYPQVALLVGNDLQLSHSSYYLADTNGLGKRPTCHQNKTEEC